MFGVTRSDEVRAVDVPTLIFAFLPKIRWTAHCRCANFTRLAKTWYVSANVLPHS